MCPYHTRPGRNGTLFVHAFLVPSGQDPMGSDEAVHQFCPITTYSYPKSEVFSLMGDSNKVRKL